MCFVKCLCQEFFCHFFLPLKESLKCISWHSKCPRNPYHWQRHLTQDVGQLIQSGINPFWTCLVEVHLSLLVIFDVALPSFLFSVYFGNLWWGIFFKSCLNVQIHIYLQVCWFSQKFQKVDEAALLCWSPAVLTVPHMFSIRLTILALKMLHNLPIIGKLPGDKC